MWILKILLLATIAASTIPKEVQQFSYKTFPLTMDFESEEQDEEEENEELAA